MTATQFMLLTGGGSTYDSMDWRLGVALFFTMVVLVVINLIVKAYDAWQDSRKKD